MARSRARVPAGQKKSAPKKRRARKTSPSVAEETRARFGRFFPDMKESTRATLLEAWATGTRKQHKVGLRDYLQWVEEQDIPDAEVFPASAVMLEDFASSWVRRKGSAGIKGKMDGIRAFHIANRLPWNFSVQLKYVLEGVKRKAPKDGKKDPRKPVTYERLEMLADDLEVADPKDIAVMAIATIAFFAQTRLGELLPTSKNLKLFDPEKNPTKGDLGETLSRKGSRTLHLPWTKVKKEVGEDVVICAQLGKVNPIAALELHILANRLEDDDPLGSFMDLNGERQLLSTRLFMARCNDIWKSRGLTPLTGHCFRIGGTTFYLLAGTKTDVVKALGRWSSDAFLRYWRSVELLGIMYIEGIVVKKGRRGGACA